MKLLNAQQIHQWDEFTMAHEPISSVDLMERAARRCTDWLLKNIEPSSSVRIFCGKGNNGGDGLAIARQLIEAGLLPVIYILEFGAKGTEDFQINLNRLHELTKEIYFIQSKDFFPELDKDSIVIDALFGSGLNRPLKDLSAELVEHINASGAEIISIDIPSGMFIDKSSIGNSVIKATATLSFQSKKLCFLVAENAVFFGEVVILDIKLHPGFTETIDTDFSLVDLSFIRQIIQPRKKFSHKGTFGHALLIAGNKGKIGAAILAAKACLRTGAGLLTCHLPQDALSILHTTLPESMASVREEEPEWDKYTAIGIGPGLGTKDDAVELLKNTISNFHKPVIVDADALNIISKGSLSLKQLRRNSIITPHPKEFDRLFGNSSNDFERIEKALKASKELSLVIVLKGHYSLIAKDGKGWFNTTGNPGMATGGSGDVLTGIITSLLAQKYEPLNAAVAGVYLHGLAGDLALQFQSEESLLPSDISKCMGKAFRHVLQGE